MIFSIKDYASYNLKELLRNGHLMAGLLGALVPALLVTYYILTNSTPFYIKYISNFYCMLGMLAAVLHPLYLVNRDYSFKTISLINNSRQNRKNYVFANIVVALYVSLFYAALGVGLLLVTHQLGVPGELKASFLLGFSANVFLLVLTFFLFGYVLLLYGLRSGAVYGILTALLLFVHNILANVLESINNGLLSSFIEHFPFYFYPVMVGSNPLSPLQYAIGCLTLIVLLVMTLKKSEKMEV
ncbi:ABC transporter permease [Gracilibacillus phocaeensis]|uniref:ABC transporter permease n=1 Tax=Gracilibacillus phocaeensis TaxID=2042304 RepID=UPI00102FBBE7|nr:ABC transporter permease [Gracilibacillus phocaeensis]